MAVNEKQAEQFGRAKELADLTRLLSDPGNRRVIWRILGTCRLLNQSYALGSPDLISATMFNEGVRSVGLRWYDEINEADPNAFGKMRDEAEQENRKRKKPKGEKENED